MPIASGGTRPVSDLCLAIGSSSARVPRFRQPLHAGPEREDAPGERLLSELGRREPLRRRSDVEYVEVRPAKAAAGGIRDRHRNLAVDPTIGSIAHDAPTTV